MTGVCVRCNQKTKLFHIPWTGERLCSECIGRDSVLQQMFAETDSMVYDQHLHALGIPTDLPDGMDAAAYIIEPDSGCNDL